MFSLCLLPKGFLHRIILQIIRASQVALVVKSLPANELDVRDMGSVPRLGRSPGGGQSNPLQYSCLENPMDRGAWRAMVHRVAKSRIGLKWGSMQHTAGKKLNCTPSFPAKCLQGHLCMFRWATDSPVLSNPPPGLSFLQGIFPTQGSNPGLPHCRRILYQLSHQGSPSAFLSPHLSSKRVVLWAWLPLALEPSTPGFTLPHHTDGLTSDL